MSNPCGFVKGDLFEVQGGERWKSERDITGEIQYRGEVDKIDYKGSLGKMVYCKQWKSYVIKVSSKHFYYRSFINKKWGVNVDTTWSSALTSTKHSDGTYRNEPNMRLIKKTELAKEHGKIIESVRSNLLAYKDEIIKNSSSSDKLLSAVNRKIEDDIGRLVAQNKKVIGYPTPNVAELTRSTKALFQQEWYNRQADRDKSVKTLLWETEMAVMDSMEKIVSESQDEDSCISLMRSVTREFAKKFVAECDVLDEVPTTKLLELERKIEHDFRDAYNEKKDEKTQQLIAKTRTIVMKEKRSLFQKARNIEDCEELLRDLIFKKTERWVEDEDLHRKDVNDLVAKLTPEFVNAYRKYKDDKIASFTDNLRNRVMMEKRQIISLSDSTASCVELLEEKIDQTALFLQDKDPSIGEQPLGAIQKIKSELTTIFKKEIDEEMERQKEKNDHGFRTMESSSLTRETKEVKGGVDVTAVAKTFGEAMIRVMMDSLSGGTAEVLRLIKDRLVKNVEHLCVEAYHSKKNSWKRSAKVVFDDQTEEHILILFRLDSYKKEVITGCNPFCWSSSTTMEYKAKSFLVTATTRAAKERLAKMRIQKAEQLEKQILDWNLFSIEEIEE